MKRIKTINVRTLLVVFITVAFLTALPQASTAKNVRLNVGFTIDETLESLACNEGWQYTMMGCVFWPLIYDVPWIMGPAPEYGSIPSLSTNWESSADRKTWRFNLHPDARFHDGKPVTAHDLAFTIEHLPAAVPSFASPDRDVESMRVIDDHTLEFTLKAAQGAPCPPINWVPVLPKHIWEKHVDDWMGFDNAAAVGSGRYKLKEFKPGQYLWLEANKDHFDPVAIDELVFKFYGSQDALNMAIKKGEVDMTGYQGISHLRLKEFKKEKDIEVMVSPGIALTWITFNLHKDSAVKDLRVRKAIMHSIDRDKIIDLVFQGYAKSQSSFIYPELPGHNPDIPKYEFNIEKAGNYLDAAGYVDTDADGMRNDPATGKNVSLEMILPSDWFNEVKVARLIKESLKTAGIDLKLKVLDLDTYLEFNYTPSADKFDLSLAAEEPGPWAEWIWEFCRSIDGGGEGWNAAYYNSAEFDTLLNTYTAEIDPVKRKNLLFQMQQKIAEELPYSVLYRADNIDPVRTDRLTGYTASMGGVSCWINHWTYFNIRPK